MGVWVTDRDYVKITATEAMHAQQLTAMNLLLEQWMDDPSKDMGQLAAATLMTAGALITFVLASIDPQAPHAELGYEAIQEALDDARQELEFVKLAGYRLSAVVSDSPGE